MIRSTLAAALLTFLAIPGLAAPPTPKEIAQTYSGGDYRATLRQISQALALRGGAAEGYDRYELLMTKGECLVQLDTAQYAIEAFEDARESTQDPLRRARARANELIVQRSPLMRYVPKTGKEKSPIDIKSAESRKRAFAALRADLLSATTDKVTGALGAQDLVPTISLLPTLRDLAVLEVAATGDFAETKPVLAALGKHARALITRELKSTRAHVEELNAAANELVVNAWDISRRGLFSDERKDLAATEEYVRQIETAGREGRRIAHLLNGDVDAWERIVAEAEDQSIRIDSILRRPN